MMKFLAIFLALVGLGLISFTVYPVFAQLADNDSDSKSGILVAITNNSMYNVPYYITGGIVNEIIPLCDSTSVVVAFDSDETGKLRLDIPRNLLDPKSRDGDGEFFVILNGEEIPYDDINNKYSRELLYSSLNSDLESLKSLRHGISHLEVREFHAMQCMNLHALTSYHH